MEDKKVEPPPGCRPIWIQMKNYDQYKLRQVGAEDDDLTALKPYVLLDRATLLEDVVKFGFMCDWNDFKADLESCSTDEILLIGDPEKVYGERWFFTYTAEAFEEQLKQQRAREEEERARLEAEAESARLKEEEANRKPEYEDKPIIARAWESKTNVETIKEVRNLSIRPERPLVVMTVTRPRRSFGLPCNFMDRDAFDWLTDDYMAKIGIRKYLATGFTAFDSNNPDRKLMDSHCQTAAESRSTSSQTAWFRSVHSTVQYSPMHLEPYQRREIMASEGMMLFLRKVVPVVEQSLQENETVDIFQDVFSSVGDEDAPVVKTNQENELKELRTFMDLVHSKNKVMAAIDWMPGRNGCVAVSAVKNLNFNERVKVSGQVDNAYVLIWDFADLIQPMLKLESPHEIFCFRFNPSTPGIVVGGAINGQVVSWDITKSLEIIHRKKRKQSVRQIGKVATDDDAIAALPPVKPHAVSHIDMSHRSLVADLAWLPVKTQVNSKGQLLGDDHLTNHTHQFITVASDGQCLIWDTRYQEMAEGLLPYIGKPRQNYDKRREDHGRPPPAPWIPLFRLQLNRIEDVGELGLCRIALDLGVAGDEITTEVPEKMGEEVDLRSQLICTTEEGEILLADWRARIGVGGKEDDPAGGTATGNEDGGDIAPEFVKWVSRDHTRPCVALDKSPFFPGVLLSVGDWSFQIWKVGYQKAVFSSPMAANYLTAGRWSPTRPGMLILGKVDGSIDVWDFTDSSYAPSVTLMSSPSRITSMEFLKPKGMGGAAKLKQQLLSVGDAAGNLHVYDVPQNLWRPLTNETTLMSNFIDREMKRTGYVAERFELRTAEADASEAEELQHALTQPADGGEAVGDDGASETTTKGGTGKAAVDSLLEPLTDEERAHLAELEYGFIEELGLSDKDFSDHYIAEKKLAEEENQGQALLE